MLYFLDQPPKLQHSLLRTFIISVRNEFSIFLPESSDRNNGSPVINQALFNFLKTRTAFLLLDGSFERNIGTTQNQNPQKPTYRSVVLNTRKFSNFHQQSIIFIIASFVLNLCGTVPKDINPEPTESTQLMGGLGDRGVRYLHDVVVFGLAGQFDGRPLDGIQIVWLEQESRRANVIYHGHFGGRLDASQLVFRHANVASCVVENGEGKRLLGTRATER